MTFAELDSTLPNGLHDAYLVGMTVSFETGTATLKLEILVSQPGEETRYENAEIRLSGLVALVIDGPQEVSTESFPLPIDSFETSEKEFPGLSRFPQAVRTLFYSLYVNDPWNSFIHIAATSAEIEWESKSFKASG